MTCEEFADVLQAFLDGDILPLEEARVRGHLRTCASCQAVLAGYRWVVRAAQQLKKEPEETRPSPIDRALPGPGQAAAREKRNQAQH